MVKKKRKVVSEEVKEKVITKTPIEERKLVDKREIALDFAEKVHKKFDRNRVQKISGAIFIVIGATFILG